MQKIIRFLKSDSGAAEMVEYSIVLPLCLFVVFFLYLVGFYLNQKAIVDSACERGLVVATKMYVDPTSNSIYDFTTGTEKGASGFENNSYDYGSMTTDPYRYWSGNYRSGEIETTVKKYVTAVIENSQLVVNDKWAGTPVVTYKSSGNLLGQNIEISVSQEYTLIPLVGEKLMNGRKVTIESTAKTNIVSQTEFIRNTDFICDLLGQWGAAQTCIDKVSSALDKVTEFFRGGSK